MVRPWLCLSMHMGGHSGENGGSSLAPGWLGVWTVEAAAHFSRRNELLKQWGDGGSVGLLLNVPVATHWPSGGGVTHRRLGAERSDDVVV